MKLTIVGGGGFRVPLVYGALLGKAERLGLEEVVLHDVDADRLDADRRRCSTGWRRSAAGGCRSARTTDLDDALEGTDYVFCAIRSGRLEGRVVDERCRSRSACSGRRRPGRAGSASRCARSPRWSRSPRRWPRARPARG